MTLLWMNRLPHLEGVLRRWALSSSSSQPSLLWLRGGLLTRQLVNVDRSADDVDFLAAPGVDADDAVVALRTALRRDVDDDVIVDVDSATDEDIFEETEFPGRRLTLPTTASGTTVDVQIDIGFGDVADPVWTTLSTSDGGDVRLWAVAKETLTAWKLHGLFEREDNSWRVKDLHDLQLLLATGVDDDVLRSAVQQAFATRDAPLWLLSRLWGGRFGTSKRSRQKWRKHRRDHPERQADEDIRSVVEQVATRLRDVFVDVVPDIPPPFALQPTLQDVRDAVNDDDTFAELRHDGWTVVSYVRKPKTLYADLGRAITTVDWRRRRLQRECRGITFDDDGACIARPLHAFPSLDLRQDNVDGAFVLEKLDGSLVFPTRVDGEDLWRTRRGPSTISAQVQRYVDDNVDGVDWPGFLAEVHRRQLTPCFEWCTRRHRIVLDHPTDRLVLLALRSIHDGTYLVPPAVDAFARAFGVECVRMWGRVDGDLDELVLDIKQRQQGEGVVLQTPDHRWFKLKSDRYKRLHQLVEGAHPLAAAIALLLDDDGEAVVDVWSGRGKDGRPLVAAFAQAFAGWCAQLQAEVDVHDDRRGLADAIRERPGVERNAMFAAFAGHALDVELKKACRRQLTSAHQLEALAVQLGLPLDAPVVARLAGDGSA